VGLVLLGELRDDCGPRPGVGWVWTRIAERPSPPANIVPLAEFVSDSPVDADRLEAAGLVEPDACGIGQNDARMGADKSLLFQEREERFVELAPHTLPSRMFADIDADVARPSVSRTGAVGATVSVTGDAAIIFAYQPGMGDERFAYSLCHLLAAGRLGFEGDGCSLNDRRIDGCKTITVVRRRQTHAAKENRDRYWLGVTAHRWPVTMTAVVRGVECTSYPDGR